MRMYNVVVLFLVLSGVSFGYTLKKNDQGQITVNTGGDKYQIYSIPALGLTADGIFTPLLTDSLGRLQVSGGGSGGGDVNIFDSAGNALTSTAGALNVNASISFPSSLPVTQDTSPWVVDGSGFTQPISGSVSVSNFPATQPISGSVSVSNFPATQPVSGTVTANQGGTWTTGRTWVLNSGTDSVAVTGSITASNPSVGLTAATAPTSATQIGAQDSGGDLQALLLNASGALLTDSSATTQPISGSVSVSNFPATQPISGTVTANQGTSPWVTSVSNFPATTAVTQSTSPWVVSGTVTANAGTGTFQTNVTNSTLAVTQSGAWTTGRTWTLSSGTDSVAAAVSNFPATQAVTQSTSPWVVSGTVNAVQSGAWAVTANAGTNLNTSALALDATVTALQVAQGSTTSGQKGGLTLGAVTTAAPTYTTAQTSPLSLTTGGALRVDASGTTQPISGTVSVSNFPATQAVTQSTSPWVVSGTVAATQSGTWNINNISGTISLPTGAATESTLSTLNGKIPSGLTVTSTRLLVDGSGVTQPVSGTVTANQGTSPWVTSAAQSGTWTVQQGSAPWSVSQSGGWTVTANAGTNLNTSALALDASVVALEVAQGSTTSGQKGILNLGAVTTAAPTYTTAQTSPLSLTTAGALRVDASGSTQPVSGTVAATQSGAWTTGRTWTLASGTDSVAAVQSGTWNVTNVSGTVSLPTGASTSALQTTGNTTLSTISGQLPTTLGAKTTANSLAVNIASDQTVAISAAALPLPSGAATSALQTAGNASLASIDTDIDVGLSTRASLANQTNGTQKTQVVDGSGNVQPSGDAVARRIFTSVTDGTNTAGVKAASTAAVAADPAMVVAISPNNTIQISTKSVLTGNAPATATCGVASGAAVAANASRKGLILTNTSINRISFHLNNGSAVLNSGATLYPGGTYVMDEYTFTTAAINCIASAASSTLGIQEFQ